MPPFETREYLADSDRRSRLLNLYKKDRPSNEFWESYFLYGKWTLLLTGAVLLAFFTYLEAPVLLLAGGLVIVLTGAAVLVPYFLRLLLGMPSCWHNFDEETLILGENAVTFSMRHATLKVWDEEPYKWVMKYEDISRIQYVGEDRKLRLWGSFDEEACRRPDLAFLPDGMRNIVSPRYYVEVPLYFKESIQILELLQERTGIFASPALPAGDYLDIQDLLGLSKEPWLKRPVIAALAVYTALFVFLSLFISSYRKTHPFQPYPKTDISQLTRVFEDNDTAILDGCEITVGVISALHKPEGVRLSVEMRNNSGKNILFHWDETNFRAETLLSENPECVLTAPPEASVLIEPEGVYRTECVLQWEGDAEGVKLEFSSDYWYRTSGLRRREYVGYPVQVITDGKTASVISNVITFILKNR